jgi:hypothetical protein
MAFVFSVINVLNQRFETLFSLLFCQFPRSNHPRRH